MIKIPNYKTSTIETIDLRGDSSDFKVIVGKKRIASDISVQNFIKFVCNQLKVNEREMLGKRRGLDLVKCRQVLSILLVDERYLGLGYLRAAKFMRKDHSSLINYSKKLAKTVNGAKVIEELWNIWNRKIEKRSVYLEFEPEFGKIVIK